MSMRSRVAGLGFAAMLLVTAAHAGAATAGKRIALSNNYAGNSWRQTMLTSWTDATGKAVKMGIVKEAPAFTTAENQVTEQAAQIPEHDPAGVRCHRHRRGIAECAERRDQVGL